MSANNNPASQDEQTPPPPPIRVMLWMIPRTLSTAFTKCLSFVEGIQIISEPFIYAYYCGPEGKQNDNPDMKQKYGDFLEKADNMSEMDQVNLEEGFTADVCTYRWCKRLLEDDYPGKKVVFCKDAPYTLCGQFDDRLPRGYQHTFIIRHPHKVFISWKKLAQKFLQIPEPFNFHDLPEPGCPAKYGFEEQYDLYHHVASSLGAKKKPPIVIDADDLQRHPASIMRQYCEAVGIPFTEDLLQWEEGDAVLDTWIAPKGLMQGNRLGSEGGFYDNALKSTCFAPPTKIPERSSLPPDLQHMSDVSMPFYAKMYECRLKP